MSAQNQQVFKELAAGTGSGVVQVLIAQPFDTIKVRLQSQGSVLQYGGALDCLRQTVQREGALALYKGTMSPLAGIAFCVSIQFATLEHMKRRFKESNAARNVHEFTPLQLYVSGGIAGVANSLISGPVEHIRTRMQVQTTSPGQSGGAQYKSTYDCAKQIFKQFGIRGIYKGQGVTMLREWQGYGGYFWAYETLVQRARQSMGPQSAAGSGDLPVWQVMTFGAVAGYVMWIPIFPIDSVKSRLQTDALNISNQKYRGMVDCLIKTLKVDGIAGLYRGFWPCMLRAAPVNAATFLAYEQLMKLMSR
ncbi:hypothetical protein MIR68_002746 [Amoeboaphelidium protococcarum]|nr:hypothetical protein MIR68_002746 [Amoeboaphelidium protococcarum]